MLLRITRGTVASGRESDFIAICRQQVVDFGRAPGLVTFLSGYRRIKGADEYLLAATWESEDDASRTVCGGTKPTIVERLAGVASVESFDVYTVIGPPFRGIVDVPGGVVRFSSGLMPNSSRSRMQWWLKNMPRGRTQDIQRLLLGWAVGERPAREADSTEVVAISAWPSQVVIESIAEPGDGPSAPLFSEIEDFISAFRTEQFRALDLDLPDALADIGLRRVVAARFDTRAGADAAAEALNAIVASPDDAQMSVAPLGASSARSSEGSFVLVARIATTDYARAERLIADQGGDVILSRSEKIVNLDSTATESTSMSPPDLDRGMSATK